jgi:HlyD family secretion protein
MNIKSLFIIAGVGIIAGLASVFFYHERIKTQPPVAVHYNPYAAGIYASGIIESYQSNGSNVNIYPEVSGKVIRVFVQEADIVKKDTPILAIDDTVQREIVEKDAAEIRYADANRANVTQQLEKIEKAYRLNSKSISQNIRDNAINAVKIAQENKDVATAQYNADKASLAQYLITAPIDGVIFRIVAVTGGYVSPQGSYDTYTQGMLPTVQMGTLTPYLQVRCYLDEILIPKLPNPKKLSATLFIRGLNDRQIPLEFVSIQPLTIPNIQLSDQQNKRVDVRVLPLIFKFKKPMDINIFPGQLVDVYIKGQV